MSLIDIPFAYALAVVRGGDVVYAQGDTATPRPLQSVTKVIASWAALVAVERHLIGLDDAAGPSGSTVCHLLAHASGLPAESEEPQFAPEKRRVYSNAGFDVLGRAVEEATGTPIRRWIEEAVLEPLGMADTDVPGSIARSGVSPWMI